MSTPDPSRNRIDSIVERAVAVSFARAYGGAVLQERVPTLAPYDAVLWLPFVGIESIENRRETRTILEVRCREIGRMEYFINGDKCDKMLLVPADDKIYALVLEDGRIFWERPMALLLKRAGKPRKPFKCNGPREKPDWGWDFIPWREMRQAPTTWLPAFEEIAGEPFDLERANALRPRSQGPVIRGGGFRPTAGG